MGRPPPLEHFDWSRLLGGAAGGAETYTGGWPSGWGAELGEAPMALTGRRKLLGEAPKLDFVIGSVHMAGRKKNSNILTCITLKKKQRNVLS